MLGVKQAERGVSPESLTEHLGPSQRNPSLPFHLSASFGSTHLSGASGEGQEHQTSPLLATDLVLSITPPDSAQKSSGTEAISSPNKLTVHHRDRLTPASIIFFFFLAG